MARFFFLGKVSYTEINSLDCLKFCPPNRIFLYLPRIDWGALIFWCWLQDPGDVAKVYSCENPHKLKDSGML